MTFCDVLKNGADAASLPQLEWLMSSITGVTSVPLVDAIWWMADARNSLTEGRRDHSKGTVFHDIHGA